VFVLGSANKEIPFLFLKMDSLSRQTKQANDRGGWEILIVTESPKIVPICGLVDSDLNQADIHDVATAGGR